MIEDWNKCEAYYTPADIVALIANSGYLPSAPTLAVDPCVGAGAFLKVCAAKEWITCDIRDVERAHKGRHIHAPWQTVVDAPYNVLAHLAGAELVVSNPPFSLAQLFVEIAWLLCPNAQVWILQRRTWHDQARALWFQSYQPDEINIGRRIRFVRPDGRLVGKGTDQCLHTMYGFSPSYRRRGPHGGICRTIL